jgi:hypothetical protein
MACGAASTSGFGPRASQGLFQKLVRGHGCIDDPAVVAQILRYAAQVGLTPTAAMDLARQRIQRAADGPRIALVAPPTHQRASR